MRGNKPKPRNLKVIDGSFRKDRDNPNQPEVQVSAPAAPEYLTNDEVEVFAVTADRLARMRVMTEADVDALAMYAVKFTQWKDAGAKVREGGMIVRSPKGFPMQNPYLSIANQAQKECLKILVEFGLTPSSRTRVNMQ